MKLLFRSLFIFALLTTISCEKSLLGDSLLSEDDKIQGTFTDTTTLVTKVVLDASVRGDRLAQNLLGSMNDPIFGKTAAGIVVEFGLPLVGFPDKVGGYEFDSIILNLQTAGFYGDSTKPHAFKVYKILTTYDKNQMYYSNLTPNISMIEVGSLENYYFKPKSQQIINGVSSATKRISIKLSDAFGASIVNHLGSNSLASNDNIQQFLPGLYVVPDTTNFGGGVGSINLNSLVSNLSLYYKNSNNTNLVSAFTTFITGFNINTFRHNYSGTPIENILNNVELAKETSYVQGASGVKTLLTFPNIEAFKNKGVLKAEIEVTELYDNSKTTFTPLSRMLAVRIDSSGTANLRDYTFYGENHFDGFGRDTVDLAGNKIRKYKINITDYFKNLLIGNFDNNGLYLLSYIAQEKKGGETNSNIYTPARTIIGGSNHPNDAYRVKLLLRYSELND